MIGPAQFCEFLLRNWEVLKLVNEQPRGIVERKLSKLIFDIFGGSGKWFIHFLYWADSVCVHLQILNKPDMTDNLFLGEILQFCNGKFKFSNDIRNWKLITIKCGFLYKEILLDTL